MNAQAVRTHREAEAERDLDAILETFVDDCFLGDGPLGLRAGARSPTGRRQPTASSLISIL